MEKNIEKENLNKIYFYMREGYDDYEFYNFKGAISNFEKAIKLIPEPKNSHEFSKRLFTCLAMSLLPSKEYDKAIENYKLALNCVEDRKDPQLQFMIGKYLYESNKKDDAFFYFYKSYELAEEKYFKNHDNKYLLFFLKCKNKNNLKEEHINKTINYKGKTYTQEEWEEFEKKQFKDYAQKHNIPLDDGKPKKSFGFFLDEKDCKY
ncbi:hypothetical protein ETU08_07755 [Apibacter muscae]|uniref:tetratricopeptide repeat protein n=1 Tax=Apibacter muscae TaxID=2509004 RepID=UPI0011AC5D1F|nr:tetratricopeptide repeat protein [Apibacter muscae]TWP29175.1 hypothetical protein ETU08_07755 [Apibacter muscae]